MDERGRELLPQEVNQVLLLQEMSQTPLQTVASHSGGPAPAPASAAADLTILYDGGCPLCLREVRFLRRRDGERGRLAFVDVAAVDYDPSSHGQISYRDAMERIHGLTGTGEVVRDVEVFRRAYALVGLGWLYAPSRWPLLRGIADGLYRLWARWRLRLTGRPPLDQLCCEREGRCRL